MPKVISIRKIKRKPRCRLTLDSGDFYDISLDLVVKFKLQKNQYLAQSELDDIISEQKVIECKQAAYAYASYKPRTIRQVKDKLSRKGFDDTQIRSAIDFLTEFNLLDDKKFAENFVRNTLRRKAVGKFKIISLLQQKGIGKDIAADAVEAVFPHDETFDMALEAARKKLHSIAKKEKNKQKTSIISFLKNRGFDWDTIRRVNEELFREDNKR